MKKHFLLILMCSVVIAGCSTLQDPSKKSTKRTSPVLTDFSNPNANQAYYEFSSSPLDKPSVLEEPEETPVEVQEPGDDEDFTAENIANAYGTYGDVVVTVASHKFKLGENATRQDMTKFQKALDAGYLAALRQYRPVGFTYAMSSVGTVNPLSDIEVNCKLSERSANQVGQATCRNFFNTVESQYIQLNRGVR